MYTDKLVSGIELVSPLHNANFFNGVENIWFEKENMNMTLQFIKPFTGCPKLHYSWLS